MRPGQAEGQDEQQGIVTGGVVTAVTVTFREGGHCPGKVTGGDGHSREVVTEGGMVTAGEGKSAGG